MLCGNSSSSHNGRNYWSINLFCKLCHLFLSMSEIYSPNDEKEARSLHGLTRTNIHNMVVGVTEGFRKDLEIQGVGYRCAKQGSKLVLTLGFSHPVEVAETETIKIEVKDALHFSILGSDKQEVGQFAAEVRSKRPPEPYKGKGIRYVGEFVIRKEGKAGKGK